MKKFSLVLLFFLVLASIRTFPLLTHLGTHLPSDPYEPQFITWILTWDVHALITDPLSLFNANIFYPVKRALALSEHSLGLLPFFAPTYLLTGNPVLAHNLTFLSAITLSGFAMFCLAYHWTRAIWASLAAGTLFAFSPIRFAHMSHVHLVNFFWAPLALLFLDRFLRSPRWLDLAAFGVCYWFQVLSSVYLGYMTAIAITIYAGYYCMLVDRTVLRLSVLPKVLTFLGASLVILVPPHLPYVQVSRDWGVSRAYDELIKTDVYVYLSAEPLNYLSVPPFIGDVYRTLMRSLVPLAETVGTNEKWLFPGLVLPTLMLMGSLGRISSMPVERVRTLRWTAWVILIGGFLLSLGPYLVIVRSKTEIPLPYLVLFHTIPGFRAMRSPARFAMLVVLAACLLAALGATRLGEILQRFRKCSRTGAFAPPAVAFVVMTLTSLELGLRPLPLARIPPPSQVPEVYRWLAVERPGPVIELPVGATQDYDYMYYSTTHWLPLVNGVSGYFPPTYQEIKDVVRTLPSARAVNYLKAIGVKAVVLHTDRLRPDELADWSAQVSHGALEKVKEFGPDILYRVPAGAAPSPPHLKMSLPALLPAGTRVKLGLSISAPPGASWVHPRPHELSAHTLSRLLAEWKDTASKKILAETRLRLPLVVLPNEPVVIPLSLETPRTPGSYVLELAIPSINAGAGFEGIEIRGGEYPTSLNAPFLLSASYGGPEQLPIAVSGIDSISVRVTARNTGKAVWLAETKDEKGAVRLGWRWFRGSQEPPDTSGRALLPYDIFPGQSNEFQALINPPARPGTYTLEVGLASELVAWFSDLGIPPLRLSVKVDRPFPCDSFDNLLLGGSVSIADALRLRLSTDHSRYRPGDPVHLFMKLDSAREPRTIDVYLVLRGHDCSIRFFEYDRNLIPHRRGPWPVFWRRVLVAKASDQPPGRFHSFPLAGLPTGSYIIHLLFTEPNSNRIITHANSSFQIE